MSRRHVGQENRMSLNAPLAGVRIVEFEGLGPGPLAG